MLGHEDSPLPDGGLQDDLRASVTSTSVSIAGRMETVRFKDHPFEQPLKYKPHSRFVKFF
jgi:hypothetical protein